MSALAEALVAAQAELPCSIPRDAEGDNGTGAYRYVTLDALLALVRPVLTSHGIALTQWPESLIVFAGTENPATLRPVLVTRLEHVSGEKIEYKTPLYVTPPDMQSLGSAITYARRYAIQAALGIAAETDDDGRKASGKDIPF